MVNFVVLGLARDSSVHAPMNVQTVLELSPVQVCVLENDSKDGTAEALASITDPRLDLISLRLGAPLFPSTRSDERAAAMRSYRAINRLQALQFEADFYVVIDFDLEEWSKEGLYDTLDRAGTFDVMAANGVERTRGNIYDLWAWREETWDPVRGKRAKEIQQKRFSASDPLYPVLSAFGGIAVYSAAAFNAGNYLAYADLGHGSLHRDLWDKGFRRVFINPAMRAVWSGPRRPAQAIQRSEP